MLANRTDYRPEAIAAMEEILQERNLPANEIQSMLSDAEQAKQAQAQLAEEPMPLGLKMTLLVFPVIGFIGAAVVSLYLKEKGYHQKAADTVLWTVLGLLFWGSLVSILSV
ncbi:MAG: hypothetical protein IPN95_13130 [Bacteroidetes bacterium]|nr:hypothetical protein [Bacteroidota bacterium]